MKYQILFELRNAHGGYPQGFCSGVRIQPSEKQPNGIRALARHRLITKPQLNGLTVLGCVDDRRKPFIRLDNLSLSFDLIVSDQEFALRTDLDPIRRLNSPIWVRRRSDTNLRLRSGESRLLPNVLAGVEITGIRSSWLRKPRHFIVPFAAKKTRWVYYLFTNRKGKPPRIVDKNRTRSLEFDESPTNDYGLINSDAIAALLREGRDSRNCYRLVSRLPVSNEKTRVLGLALYSGDQLLIPQLPHPSIRNYASLDLSADSMPQEVLYHALDY